MANPQPTDAHLRTAHSINEAIMLRDFTKRQRKILDLILRLSWGCGKKEAYIPHQNDFTVVGIYEPDIKSELSWLEESKVIGRNGALYWFKKDFEQWQVSRVKPYQPEKLSNLLSLNLNGNNPELSKTLSENLVKHEVETSQNTKFSTPNLASPKERGEGRGGEKVPLPSPHKEILNKRVLDIDNKASKLWAEILVILQSEVSKANFSTWLENTVGVQLSKSKFLIGTPNKSVAGYLNTNQRSLIERVISQQTGERITAEFVIVGDDEKTN